MLDKKSQSEIFGLVIIILIMIVGILLIYFLSNRNKENPEQIYYLKTLTNQYIKVMLKKDVECNDKLINLRSILTDCIKNKDNQNKQLSCKINNQNIKSCDLFKKEIKKIFNSLDPNVNLKMIFIYNNNQINDLTYIKTNENINQNTDPCKNKDLVYNFDQPIPILNGGLYHIRMKMCFN